MADNSIAKAMGEVKNVRVQIGYQAFLRDFLVLNIPVVGETFLKNMWGNNRYGAWKHEH